MTALRPRALVHQGRHLAAGVLLPLPLLGEAAARRRVLEAWQPGDEARAVEGGLLHRFGRPRHMDAGAAPGLLLVEDGGALLGLPLSPAEREALAPPSGAVVVARGGEAVSLSTGAQLDPAAWLDLAPRVVTVAPLGGLATVAAPAPPPAPPHDLREVLSVPPAAAQAGAVVASLQVALDRLRQQPGSQARPAPAPASAATGEEAGIPIGAAVLGILILSRLLAMIARDQAYTLLAVVLVLLITGLAVGGLISLIAAAGRAVAPGAPAGPARPVPGAALPVALRPTAPRPTWLGRAWDRFLVATQLMRLAGLRQAAYLDRLMRQLDDGDLDEALRTALPLGKGEGGPLSLGLPGRRANLEITTVRGPGPVVPLEVALQQALRERYRRAFQRLERLGRHDEAAFVLAELLGDEAEAVAYLERHGRLRQAAELAEGRGLPAGLVIRQWFLAGERDRAVRLARATGHWADAVSRLERSQRTAEAAALRLAWAADLAEAGNLEAAVRAARPVPAAAALVERWIELAVAAGGPIGERLLGPWLEVRPDRFAAVRERVLAACADAGPEGPARRREVADGLLAVASTPAVRCLARPMLRATMADAGRGEGAADLQRLRALAGDGLLDADRPAAIPAAAKGAPARIAFAVRAGDRGTAPVLDAAALPGGRVLLAQGEAGVRLLARDGRTVARFDVPAHALVVSDTGTRALALGGRGEVLTVFRLDLDARTSRRLRDVRLDGWAPSFDGVAWPVRTGNAVMLLDTLRDDLRALWHVSDLEGLPFSLGRPMPGVLAFAVEGPGGREGWWYEDGALRERRALLLADGQELLALAAVANGRTRAKPGWWCAAWREAEDGPPWLGWLDRTLGESARLEGVAEVLALQGGSWPAAAVRTAEGVEVRLLGPGLLETGRIQLAGASEVVLRTAGNVLTASDDQGRVVAVDVARGAVLADLRS